MYRDLRLTCTAAGIQLLRIVRNIPKSAVTFILLKYRSNIADPYGTMDSLMFMTRLSYKLTASNFHQLPRVYTSAFPARGDCLSSEKLKRLPYFRAKKGYL